MRIAIVILNYNSFKETLNCVNSIKEFTQKYPYKIFIVDNASSDESRELLHAEYDNNDEIVIIENKINGGYSYGNNIGIECAKKEGYRYIFISNPDVILRNDAVTNIVDSLKEHSEVAIAGPLIYERKNMVQFARKEICFSYYILKKLHIINEQSLLRCYSWDSCNDFIFQGSVVGCFLCVDIEKFGDMPIFDNDFFLFFEEDVIAYKLKMRQLKSMVVGTAQVEHLHGEIIKRSGNTFADFNYRLSEFLVLKKYAGIGKIEQMICYVLANLFWRIKSISHISYKEMSYEYFIHLKQIYKRV